MVRGALIPTTSLEMCHETLSFTVPSAYEFGNRRMNGPYELAVNGDARLLQ
jgi:hypothetical protein